MNSEESQLLQLPDGHGGSRSLAYRLQRPEPEKPIFVWFCGFRSEMGSLKAEDVARFAREAGAGCLRFDYSGHGRSSGAFEDGTISAWLDDADAVCRMALPQTAPFVFAGSSMGGWIALLLALRLAQEGRSAPKAMVLIAPAWDMTRLFAERLPKEARAAIERDGSFLRPSVYGDAPYPITKKLIEDGDQHLFGGRALPLPLEMPVRILHGREDPDIPWRRSLDLADRIAGGDVRLTLIKDGEHRLSRPQDLALLRSTLGEFL